MKTIDLIQNSDDWYKFRNTRLGASEANIVMGVSKFMTPKQLWEQKIGEAKKENSAPNYIQNKGHQIEEKIRAALEIDLGHDFPPVVVLSEEYPFLMASLDGYCKELGVVLEAKYVGAEDFEKVRQGQILEHYKPQIMQQILLTGAEFAILAVMRESDEGNQYTTVKVYPDIPYIRDQLIPAMTAFWHCVENKIEPELAKKDELDQSDDVELSDMLTRYKLLSVDHDEIGKTLETLKDAIFEKVKHSKVVCNGIKIQKIAVKGRETFDYAGFLKDNDLTIPDTYKKVSKPSVTRKIILP